MKLNSFRDIIEPLRHKDPELFRVLETVDNNILRLNTVLTDHEDRIIVLEKPLSRVAIFNDVDQGILTGVLTALTFNTLLEDNDSMYDAANNTKITFRTPGWYDIGGCVQWEFVAGGNRRLAIRVNGATIIYPGDRRVAAPVPGDIVTISGTHRFNQNDYIELMVSQNTGAALNILTVAEFSPYFWATMCQKQYNMNAIPNRRQ